MADAVAAKPRARQGGFVDLVLLGVLAGGLWVVAKHVITPDFAKISAMLGGHWTPAMVQSAWKWANKRGLPFNWVLSTIIVESSANPRSTGDSGGESKGLMQVNTVANAKLLAQYGYRPDDMYDVDHGIEIGTILLRQFYDNVKAHGAERAKTPIDVTTRLAYKGPATVYAALDHGQEPSSISWAPAAISNWHAATQRVLVASGQGPSVTRFPFV